jgi:hypothetical protein
VLFFIHYALLRKVDDILQIHFRLVPFFNPDLSRG